MYRVIVANANFLSSMHHPVYYSIFEFLRKILETFYIQCPTPIFNCFGNIKCFHIYSKEQHGLYIK